MKRYRFSLETALRVRRVQEESARFALALAHRQLHHAVERHEAALGRYHRLEHDHGALDHATYVRQRDEAHRRAEAVAAAGKAVAVAVEAVHARNGAWTVASRRVAALEHLDERRRAEWSLEQQRAETAAIDESALSRWLAEAESVTASTPPGTGHEETS